MALRTLNSVGGFSVGEATTLVIDANGNVTSNYANLSAVGTDVALLVNAVNGNVALKVSGTGNIANIEGNLKVGGVLTDNLYYANGVIWDLQQAAGDTGEIQFNNGDDFSSSANLTFTGGNVLTVTGTANVTTLNVSAKTDLGAIANVKITGGSNGQIIKTDGAGNLSFVTISESTLANGTSNVTVIQDGNINLTSAGNTTMVVTGTGANITGNLSVSGNISAPGSNTYVLFNNDGNIGTDSGITYDKTTDLLTVAGNVSGNNLSATNAITGKDLTLTGNLTVGGNTVYVNVSTTTVIDPIIELGGGANGADLTQSDGKDRGLLLHNYDTGNSAASNQALVWKSANAQFEIFSSVSSYSGDVVTGTLGNIKGSWTIANVDGSVVKASSNVQTPLILNSDSNIALDAGGNIRISVDGTANVLEVDTTGAKLTGTFEVTGNANVSNLGSGNIITAVGNVSGGNITTIGVVSATGNVSGGNITTIGVVSATGNVSGGNITTGGKVVATGNVEANNVVITNDAKIGNTHINWATLTTTATTAAQVIATVSTSGIRGVEFFVKGENATGSRYSIATIAAVHDGSVVDYNIYSTINIGGTTGTLSVAYNSGNIELQVQPQATASTVWTTQYRTI